MIFSSLKDFEKAFEAFYPLLVAFANKQIHNLEASKDIVQDLFVYVYENRDELHISGALKNYLFGAVFNKCKTYQRKMIIQENYVAHVQQNEQTEFQDLLVETEGEQRIYQEINKLPKKCQLIFKLSRFEDFTNEEIAAKLNLSKRTVETQISKALKILRSKLEPRIFILFFCA